MKTRMRATLKMVPLPCLCLYSRAELNVRHFEQPAKAQKSQKAVAPARYVPGEQRSQDSRVDSLVGTLAVQNTIGTFQQSLLSTTTSS